MRPSTSGSRNICKGLEMSELERVLKSKVAEINSRKDKLEKVRGWIDGYRGKIVQLITKDEAYHIVFTKESASLRPGEYASVDVTYQGDEAALIKIVKGETTAKMQARAGTIRTRQNMSDSFGFEHVVAD